MSNFAFLRIKSDDPAPAYAVFYEGLPEGIAEKLGVTGGEMFAYTKLAAATLTFLMKRLTTVDAISLKDSVYTQYDLIFASRHSLPPLHLQPLQGIRLPWRDLHGL